MKKVAYLLLTGIVILLVSMFFSCKKEEITKASQANIDKLYPECLTKTIDGVIYHYKYDYLRITSVFSAPINLFMTHQYGYQNYGWTPQGGSGIAFKLDNVPTNPQWFSNISWYGISMPDNQYPQNCGTAYHFSVTGYRDPWYVGTDSSLIVKAGSVGNASLPACPAQPVIHGHHHN